MSASRVGEQWRFGFVFRLQDAVVADVSHGGADLEPFEGLCGFSLV